MAGCVLKTTLKRLEHNEICISAGLVLEVFVCGCGISQSARLEFSGTSQSGCGKLNQLG